MTIEQWIESRRESRLLKQKERTRIKQNKIVRRRHWLIKYKMHRGCDTCGYKLSSKALCFHNPATKRRVGQMLGWGIPKIIKEARDSKIKCMNCIMIEREDKKNVPSSNNF